MEILQIGDGVMGATHRRTLHKLAQVSVCKRYAGPSQLKGFDAAVIAAPYDLHFRIAKDALENNLGVFVEKPLSIRLDEAEELVRIADENRKVLMVGQILRYTRLYDKIRGALPSIGTIQSINCTRNTRKAIKNWWKKQERFLLLYEGVHTLDLLTMLTGTNGSVTSCNMGCTLPDFKGETWFSLEVMFGRINARLSHNMDSNEEANRIVFMGTEGILEIKGFSGIWLNGANIFSIPTAKLIDEGSEEEMKDFCRCIGQPEMPRCTGRSVLPTMACIESAYRKVF